MWAHWRHLANTIENVHVVATWRIQLNLCFFRPTRVHNPNGKSIASAVFAQLIAQSLILYNGRPFSQKLPILMGGSGRLSNSWFLGQVRAHSPNGISISSAVFAQATAEWPYTLLWGAPFLLKIALPMGDLNPHLIYDFPGPTWVLNPNGISIGSAVFSELTSLTDWLTDHATRSVTIDRIYLCSADDAA